MANLIHSVLPMPRRPVVYISGDESVKKCIELMTELNIGSLVVLDQDNAIQGMITERDVVRSCLNQSMDINTAKVGDIAYKDITILKSNDAVEEAMQSMTATKRRHVLVSEQGDIIALISIGDLVNYLLEDKARVIQHLEDYINT